MSVAKPDHSHTPNANIRVTAVLPFDGMTWNDLREFVDLATEQGIPGDQEVPLNYVDDDYSPMGIEATFPGWK